MPQLIFSRGKVPLFRVQLQSQSLKIGRSDKCDVVLTEPEISREHVAIFTAEGQYLLKKTGRGEILIRGQAVEQHRLLEGEAFSIGPWEAQFEKDGSSPEDSPDETLGTPTKRSETQAIAGNSQGILVEEYYLRIQQPSKLPWDFQVKSESLMIGADPKNDLVIKDPYISARHLKLVLQEDGVWLFDLGSTNGTYVRDMKVRETRLENGAEIKIGQCQITLLQEHHFEKPEPLAVERFHDLVGSSAAMQELYGLLQRIGPAEATALILGESGSGKELVARALHKLSPRREGPFLAVNCGAISRELIESELFGHEKGAFTGAQRRHDGAFGQANGGDPFLG